MDGRGLFSDSDGEDELVDYETDEWYQDTEANLSDFEVVDHSLLSTLESPHVDAPGENREIESAEREEVPPRRVYDRMNRVILVTPPMPVSTLARSVTGGGGGQRVWNVATQHVVSQQQTYKIFMTYILLRQTPLSGNMIRGILELVPPEYSGRQPIPDANSSIFKVHIYNNQMALLLLRSGQLYAMDLRTGQFWHNNRDYSVILRQARVRAAAFHPTKPLVMVYAWSSTTLAIVRYPTSLHDQASSVKMVEIGAVPGKGISTTNQAAATLHVSTSTITFHEFPDTDDKLLTSGFSLSTALPRLTQGAPILFTKLVMHSTADHTFKLLWQTRTGTERHWPLLLETTTRITHRREHFYGPTSRVYDANLTKDKLVAMTEKHAIFVWQQDGTHLKTFRKHHGVLQSMSVYGSLLVTASFDKSVRIWDLDTLKMVQSGNAMKHAHTGKTKPQAVALWNNRIVIGFDNKTVEVYRLS
jgi:ribosomal protein L28